MVNLHPLTPHIMPSYTPINGERTVTTDSVTSQDTSVSSALETFVIIALYKSTFTIPYHTIPYHRRTARHTEARSSVSELTD